MDPLTLEKLELNKILAAAARFAVLPCTKRALAEERPGTDLAAVRAALDRTAEADLALFRYGVSRIEDFPEPGDELERAAKGASLSCKELLGVGSLLRSARVAYRSIAALADDSIVQLKELAHGIYFDESLENDIARKIVSEDELADDASEELLRIRRTVRSLNERIRARLSEYLSGDGARYLQEAVVTMRDNRYVLPVRAEYKSRVRGFVHDRSASGATFFIEPEHVLEMNNELRELAAAEKEEIERILAQLSRRVGALADALAADVERLSAIDCAFAKAEYSYKNRCVRPRLTRGGIDIVKGRHPLLDPKTAVPVSVSLGKSCRILLVSGPNTGGKTVTLKMCGLFCLMAACGLYIPAAEGSEVAVFSDIFCDIGDAQSIEENLSTFSSHIRTVIGITERADEGSLVLIDELGGGTDPEEGQALAKAILAYLLRRGCRGIVTTHYSALKEFAYSEEGIENASMEFDMNTLQPLYRLKAGVPGSSNAIAISRRLGLKEEILQSAVANLSEGGRRFENIVRAAEQSRVEAEEAKRRAEALEAEWKAKLAEAQAERDRYRKEREKFLAAAGVESRRIIRERTARAEELLSEIESVAKQRELSEADLIRARTLKNKLADTAFSAEAEEEEKPTSAPVDAASLRAGDRVFVRAMNAAGEVLSVRAKKGEAEVLVGSMRLNVKIADLFGLTGGRRAGEGKKDRPVRRADTNGGGAPRAVRTEVNLLGLAVDEALPEVDALIDQAVLGGLEEVKIIHGVGTGRLRDGIRSHLRGHKNVAEFRPGAYGEGGAGVTIVRLK